MKPSGSILRRLMRVIEDRKVERPPDSYTTRLLDGGATVVGAKLREEADELVEAAFDPVPDRRQVVHEAADLIYHLLVLLAAADVKLDDVETELQRRFGTSGLAEKASRKP